MTPGADFTNVFRARFLQNVTRKKALVQKMRAKNARENVGEIDPCSKCLWPVCPSLLQRKPSEVSLKLVLPPKVQI